MNRARAGVVIVATLVVSSSSVVGAQARPTGSPEDHLPPNVTQLTGFGERAVWSPDGARIALMSRSVGDAFEIDLKTRITRLLTGHFRHAGFLRVHYLPNGDYFLIGARDFKDIRTTRDRDQEMWVMRAGARTPPVALGHRISEGVAISRRRMRIAWANTRGQYPDSLAEGESVLYMADVVYDSTGTPKLANRSDGESRRSLLRLPVRAEHRPRRCRLRHLSVPAALTPQSLPSSDSPRAIDRFRHG